MVLCLGELKRREIKAVESQSGKSKTKNDDEVIDLDSAEAENDPEESEERRIKRQREWGQQYDMWLIRAARKKQAVEILLSCKYPGVTRDDNLINCIPLRIDRYMVEVSVDGTPVWLSKMHIIGTKPLGGKVKITSDPPSTE